MNPQTASMDWDDDRYPAPPGERDRARTARACQRAADAANQPRCVLCAAEGRVWAILCRPHGSPAEFPLAHQI